MNRFPLTRVALLLSVLAGTLDIDDDERELVDQQPGNTWLDPAIMGPPIVWLASPASYGLTDQQARLTPSVSSLSVGGLVKHVADMERR